MNSSSICSSGIADDKASLSNRILDAVAEEEGTSPVEFDQLLSKVIDPDALEKVFRDEDQSGKIQFSYLGYSIEVQADGQISVSSLQEC